MLPLNETRWYPSLAKAQIQQITTIFLLLKKNYPIQGVSDCASDGVICQNRELRDPYRSYFNNFWIFYYAILSISKQFSWLCCI